MDEIRTFDFEGHAVTFEKHDADWWATADVIAPGLGYRHKQSVIRLFNRHKDHFTEAESTEVRLTSVDGKARVKRIFSPRGVLRLCLVGRNSVSRRFHNWLLDVAEKLREGGRVITAEQFDELRLRFEDLQRQCVQLGEQCRQLGEMNMCLAQQLHDGQQVNLALIDLNKRNVSLHASAMAMWRNKKEQFDRYYREVQGGQGTFPFIDDEDSRLPSPDEDDEPAPFSLN